MNSITNTMTTLIAQATGRRRSGIAMPTCGHASAWTGTASVKGDMGLVQRPTPGDQCLETTDQLRHQLIGSLQAAEPERDPRPFCFSKPRNASTETDQCQAPAIKVSRRR